jgi:hypothetical protein
MPNRPISVRIERVKDILKDPNLTPKEVELRERELETLKQMVRE